MGPMRKCPVVFGNDLEIPFLLDRESQWLWNLIRHVKGSIKYEGYVLDHSIKVVA